MKKIVSILTVIASTLVLTTSVSAQSYYTTSYAADAGLGIGMIIVYCCICCVALIVPLAIGYLVYKDAQKNEVDNAILWALLSAFTTWIGLLIYFLAIRPEAIKTKEAKSAGVKKSE